MEEGETQNAVGDMLRGLCVTQMSILALLAGKGVLSRDQLLEAFKGLKQAAAGQKYEASVYEMMLAALRDGGPPDPERMPDWFRGVVIGDKDAVGIPSPPGSPAPIGTAASARS